MLMHVFRIEKHLVGFLEAIGLRLDACKPISQNNMSEVRRDDTHSRARFRQVR